MESSSLATLKPLSFLTCGFEYRQLNEGSDTGYEEYYFKILGSIIINDSIVIDENSWVEVVLTYEAYVSDSPFCETEDNFYSELQEIYLRAVTKRKREAYIKKSSIKDISKSDFMMAGAFFMTTLNSIITDDDLFMFIQQIGGKLDLSSYKPKSKRNPWKNAPGNYF
jgi:hypothetical protein